MCKVRALDTNQLLPSPLQRNIKEAFLKKLKKNPKQMKEKQ
jgi:hypothetical protein